jgi:rod shape determining protein RodA
MGVMRAEPRRFADWTTKSVGAVWRAYDLQLTVYAALLATIGLVMAYSNTVGDGTPVLESGSTFARGLMWAGIAMVAFLLATAVDYRLLRTLRWPVYFTNLGLLVITLAIGDGVGGAARWVALGPFTFQFSELSKILMIIVLAAYLGSREGRLDSLRSILGACLLMGPSWVLVMLQPDLGTSLVFGAILAGMLFLSGASLKWLLTLTGTALAAIPYAWNHLLHDYQKDRLVSFLDPTQDVHGSNWQLFQSQIAVGSGGLLGTGLTNGTQNRGEFLPVQESDFVAAVFFEELGFVGAVLLFLLFGALLWRIIVAGWRSRDPFGTMFAAGLASALLFQMFVNLGMVVGIMPITGIPLPFISHGGASLVSIAIGLGILQSINIRQHVRPDW